MNNNKNIYRPLKNYVLKKGFGGKHINTSLEVIAFQEYGLFLTILHWTRAKLDFNHPLRLHAEWLFQATKKIVFPQPLCIQSGCRKPATAISVRRSGSQFSVSLSHVYCDEHMAEVREFDWRCGKLPWTIDSMKQLSGNDNLIFIYWKMSLKKDKLSGKQIFKLLQKACEFIVLEAPVEDCDTQVYAMKPRVQQLKFF